MYPVTGPAIAPQLRIAILGEGIVLDIQHKSPGMGGGPSVAKANVPVKQSVTASSSSIGFCSHEPPGSNVPSSFLFALGLLPRSHLSIPTSARPFDSMHPTRLSTLAFDHGSRGEMC